MSTIAEAPKPWENIIRVGDSFVTEPALEAAIHADARLSHEARGVLIAALSFNIGWPIDPLAVARENEAHGRGFEELHALGYLRVGEYLPTIGGARVNTTLYGRTPLAEAVAGAQYLRFVTEDELRTCVQEVYKLADEGMDGTDPRLAQVLRELAPDMVPEPVEA